MRIAVNSMAAPELPLDRALSVFATAGAEGVELIVDDQYGCGLPIFPSAGDLNRLQVLLDDTSIVPIGLSPYTWGLGADSRSEAADAVKAGMASIEAAHATGAGAVRILAGRSSDPTGPGCVRLMEDLTRLGAHALELGVALNVETHQNTHTPSLGMAVDLCNQLGNPVFGVILDPVNIDRCGYELGTNGVEELGDLLRLVHVKDRVSIEGTYVPKPLGEGDFPWAPLFDDLALVRYRGFLSIEYERRWYPELPEVTDVLPDIVSSLRSLAG